MNKYIAKENLSNGIMKGETFPASRLSKFVINELVKKGRIELVLDPPEAEEKFVEVEFEDGQPKKRKYTKRSK